MRCAIWYHSHKPATLLKLTLLHGCFSRFLNCANGTKTRNASHMKMALNNRVTNKTVVLTTIVFDRALKTPVLK